MAKTKYYEEPKGRKNNLVCCEDENKYSKWRVEEAYRSVLDAKKALEDTKMRKFIGICAKIKAQEAASAAKAAGVVAKVSKNLKEVFSSNG